MRRLVQGIHEFQQNVFRPEREFFERLEKGQSPETLFITCSDSRINPNLLTSTAPGELFILRNAGNIVPPYAVVRGGEAATVEYAVSVLNVQDIIVCGHAECGAVSALLDPNGVESLPAVKDWLVYAEATRRIVQTSYGELSPEEKINVAVQENTLVQIEHLRTHPAVAARLARGDLGLHAWVYKVATGEVFAYDTAAGQFLPVAESMKPVGRGPAAPSSIRAI
jgi:carbonic anhydrase